MTLSSLLIRILIAAIILTLVVGFIKKGHKSWIMTFLQNFTGVLFLFSGWVKAVDPLGTAYKMEQYFGEFQSTFEGTWFSFIAPLFPLLAEYAIWFSVIMIIFEILLGLMLLMGMKPKFTAWAFLLLVLFFTILTGFTYLTGYVPQEANFFSFGQWQAYDANNMKVTDCGCFGDFIKLEPKTSFYKDVILLIPAFYFIFRHRDMHQLFTENIRKIIVAVTGILLLIYCLSNFKWDIPHADFRPFKKGADIRTQLEKERDAMGSVEITHWKLKHNETGEILVLPNEEYLGNYQDYRNEYSVVEQIKDKPAIPITKISDFEITDLEGNAITDDLLGREEAHFLIVNHKLYGKPTTTTQMVRDSVFTQDTVIVVNAETMEKDTSLVRKLSSVETREEQVVDWEWKEDYVNKHIEKLKPFINSAREGGYEILMAVGGADPTAIKDFDETTGLGIEYGLADDILLKTIVRSNPGVVLMKDGVILDKWHINKLPSYDEVYNMYLK